MYTFNSFAINRLNNAEFVGLLLNMQSAISKATAVSLGLDSTTNSNFNATLKSLVDQVYTNYGSELTAKMQALDEKRDNIYRRIRLRLEAADYASEGEDLHELKDIVDTIFLAKYTYKVPSMPMNEETAILSGFILDLQDKLNETQLKALGIIDEVTALESANEAFIEAYNDRATELATGGQVTAKLRTSAQDYYNQLLLMIQFNANGMNTGEDAAEISQTCQAFVAQMNVMLDEAKSRFQQRLAKSSESDSDSTDSTKTDSTETKTDTESETKTDTESKTDDEPTVIE